MLLSFFSCRFSVLGGGRIMASGNYREPPCGSPFYLHMVPELFEDLSRRQPRLFRSFAFLFVLHPLRAVPNMRCIVAFSTSKVDAIGQEGIISL